MRNTSTFWLWQHSISDAVDCLVLFATNSLSTERFTYGRSLFFLQKSLSPTERAHQTCLIVCRVLAFACISNLYISIVGSMFDSIGFHYSRKVDDGHQREWEVPWLMARFISKVYVYMFKSTKSARNESTVVQELISHSSDDLFLFLNFPFFLYNGFSFSCHWFVGYSHAHLSACNSLLVFAMSNFPNVAIGQNRKSVCAGHLNKHSLSFFLS